MDPILGIENKKKSYKTLWITIILIIVITGIFIWYFIGVRPERKAAGLVADQIEQEFEAQIQEQQDVADSAGAIVSPPTIDGSALAPESNPVQNKVPEINPVEKVNPFNDIYTNPFE